MQTHRGTHMSLVVQQFPTKPMNSLYIPKITVFKAHSKCNNLTYMRK